ncbi:MAG: FlgB family protein [Rhodobacteraceae bacterium]|nr:FlgB family protein [Paracoccaceae bacterium]
MLEKLALLKTAGQLADLAIDRHAVTARNVANSDTPGYKARGLPNFAEVFAVDRDFQLRSTRADHISTTSQGPAARSFELDTQADPNGNTVTLETELVRSAQAKREHDLALTIYQSTLNIVRSSLGRGR